MSPDPAPIVVDGRTTDEKLRELLAVGTEHVELDYKSTLDLSSRAKSYLDFAKDCIAMMNLPKGGYLVIGVDGSGRPATDQSKIVPELFDSAMLGAIIRRYVDEPPRIASAIHLIDDWPIALIWVGPTTTRLPAIVARVGQYEADNRVHVVLQPGVIYVRDGTSNVPASNRHWSTLLERYREQIVLETRGGNDELVRLITRAVIDANSSGQLPAPTLAMDDDTFADIFRENLEDE